MACVPRMELPIANWPEQDRKRWRDAVRSGADPFDDCGPAAHLATSSRRALQGSYGRFLGFVSTERNGLLNCKPDKRVDRETIADYVTWRRRTCGDAAVVIDLHHLRLALGYICPSMESSWLLTITKRLAAQAPRRHKRRHLVTSEQLYVLGIELMERALANSKEATDITKLHAFDYRDGLIIALVALIPLRRRTIAALRVGTHLVKSGVLRSLDIPAEDNKSKRPLEYEIPPDMSERIDLYLAQFRCCLPGAKAHRGLWASNKGRPMDHGSIYDAVRRRTHDAFGFPVNLHRFRAAAGALWSIHDPANVRGVKDLLGHASFDTTEGHYIVAQSRIAGRALAHAVDTLRKQSWAQRCPILPE
jgi:integrase/recombinase XerD